MIYYIRGNKLHCFVDTDGLRYSTIWSSFNALMTYELAWKPNVGVGLLMAGRSKYPLVTTSLDFSDIRQDLRDNYPELFI